MVKIVQARPCGCSTCRRARSFPHSTSEPPSLPQHTKASSTARPAQSDTPSRPTPSFFPVASTSKVPFLPPASVRLPDELLLIIFDLARPPLPPTSPRLHPPMPAWQGWINLPLVHSRWYAAAKQRISESVVIRSHRQMRALTEALRNGWVGSIEEVLLEMKEMSRWSEEQMPEGTISTDAAVAAESDDDVGDENGADEVEGQLASRVKGKEGRSSTSDLLDLLRECGSTLKALRLRGFGFEDARLVELCADIRALLPKLETWEYSPIDSGHPPTTAGLVTGLSLLPTLKNVTVAPSSRFLTPLDELPPELTDAMSRLLETSVDFFANETCRAAYAKAFQGMGLHHLTSLSLNALALTPLTLLGLLLPSLTTLTSLTLTSIYFASPASSTTLFNILCIVAPHLVDFSFEDKLFVPLAPGAPNPFRNFGRASLPEESYWRFLGELKQVKSLRLFSSHIFEPSDARNAFILPSTLEDLTIGSRHEIEADEVDFWLDKVHKLLDSKEPQVDEVESEAGNDRDVFDGLELDLEALSALTDGGDDGVAASDGEATSDGEEGNESSAPSLSRCSSSSGSDTAEPITPPSATVSLPPTSSNLDKGAPTPSPAPFSAPPLPPTPPPSHPSPPGHSKKRPSPRKRRLSWSKPPPASTPPQLRSLSLITTDTELRDDDELQDKVEEVVARGVKVAWYSLLIVMLETLDLTRELRADILELPEGW